MQCRLAQAAMPTILACRRVYGLKGLQSTLFLVLPWEEQSLLMTGYVSSMPLISLEKAAATVAIPNQGEADEAALSASENGCLRCCACDRVLRGVVEAKVDVGREAVVLVTFVSATARAAPSRVPHSA